MGVTVLFSERGENFMLWAIQCCVLRKGRNCAVGNTVLCAEGEENFAMVNTVLCAGRGDKLNGGRHSVVC